MLMVTISTLYQSVFIIFLVYLSKGWVMTEEGQQNVGLIDLDQNESAFISAIIGGIYVSYSAQYLVLDNFPAQVTFAIILNSLYIALVFFLLKFSLKTLKYVNLESQIIQESNIRTLMKASKLKKRIVNVYIWIVAIYFLFEILVNGIVPFLNIFHQKDQSYLEFKKFVQSINQGNILDHFGDRNEEQLKTVKSSLDIFQYFPGMSFVEKNLFLDTVDISYLHTNLTLLHQCFDLAIIFHIHALP